MVEKIKARIIHVIGDKAQRSNEIEHYKEFLCYGRKNVDKVCGNCKLRFLCFTDRENIEIPIKELHKRSLRDVTMKILVNNISNLEVKIVTASGGEEHAIFNREE